MYTYTYDKDKKKVQAYDQDKCIGEITYKEADGNWLADHTYVDDTYRGQSIAKDLLDHLVKEAENQEVKIVPLCPYVVHKFDQDPAYDHIKA